MTGCFPSSQEESNFCKHGVPRNIAGCNWCDYEEDQAQPLARQVHLLTDFIYKLEKRIEKLEHDAKKNI